METKTTACPRCDETDHLLASPANAERLRQSIAQITSERSDPLENTSPRRRPKSRILRETIRTAYRLHEAKHLSDAGLAEILEIADGE
jgi:uncharacterized Zn finger protein (UPF0148 family)